MPSSTPLLSDLWLEPLLEILTLKPRAIAVPTLDLIREWDYDEKHLRVLNAYGIAMTHGHSHFGYYYTGPPKGDQSQPYTTASILGEGMLYHHCNLY